MPFHRDPLNINHTAPIQFPDDLSAPLKGRRSSISAIIDTNLCPNPNQYEQISQVVSDTEVLMETMSEDIRGLQAELRRLVQDRFRLRTNILRYKRTLSVIRHVPTDIWETVFSFCLSDADNGRGRSNTVRHILGSVCADWWKILKKPANLWSSDVWGMAQLAVRRQGVEWPLSDPDSKSSLRHWSPWFVYTNRADGVPVKLTFPWSITPPWNQIEQLYLNTHNGDCMLNTLGICRELKSLVLDCCPSFTVGRPIEHRKITTLVVANPAMLQYLILPSLISLTVGPATAPSFESAPERDGPQVLQGFLERTASKIESLEMRYLPITEALLDIVRALSQLKVLRIETDRMDKEADKTTCELIDLLTCDDPKHTACCLPQLEDFGFRCEDRMNRASFVLDGALVKMIASRIQLAQHCSLKHVNISLLRFQDFMYITVEDWHRLQGFRAAGLDLFAGATDGTWNWCDRIKEYNDAAWDSDDDDDEY